MVELRRRDLLGTAAAGGATLAAGAGTAAEATADLPAFRYALGERQGKEYEGGSAKEASVAEFPASENIAGVAMRLVPGGLRELHWHANAAEWAYVIEGHCRVTVIDPAGGAETADFGPGDVWYFPRGHGHSIQGLGPGDCSFILVFDNGRFSEYATFSVTDWLARTPPEVRAKNLGLPASALERLPPGEVYIAKGPVPPPLPADPPPGSADAPALTHRYRLLAQKPLRFPGGEVRVASAKEFPISTTMTGVLMRLDPGALRELHWHPNADEWQYYIGGRARMTVFGSKGRASTAEFGPGDVGYVPRGYGHYIESTGREPMQAILVLNSGAYEDVSLSGWLAANPRPLLAANLGLPESVLDGLPKEKVFITAAGA
jgi:oxalate decarboxylase